MSNDEQLATPGCKLVVIDNREAALMWHAEHCEECRPHYRCFEWHEINREYTYPDSLQEPLVERMDYIA